MTLYPTGKCFDNALDFIGYRLEQGFSPKLLLVHGIALFPVGPRAGERFSHAWCEEGDVVWESGLTLEGVLVYCVRRKAEFYARMRVERTTKYTIAEAYAMNAQHMNYGPWEQEYLALCRNYRRRNEGGNRRVAD